MLCAIVMCVCVINSTNTNLKGVLRKFPSVTGRFIPPDVLVPVVPSYSYFCTLVVPRTWYMLTIAFKKENRVCVCVSDRYSRTTYLVSCRSQVLVRRYIEYIDCT